MIHREQEIMDESSVNIRGELESQFFFLVEVLLPNLMLPIELMVMYNYFIIVSLFA